MWFSVSPGPPRYLHRPSPGHFSYGTFIFPLWSWKRGHGQVYMWIATGWAHSPFLLFHRCGVFLRSEERRLPTPMYWLQRFEWHYSKEQVPLPLMSSAFELLQGARVFTKFFTFATPFIWCAFGRGMSGRWHSTPPRDTTSIWFFCLVLPMLQPFSRVSSIAFGVTWLISLSGCIWMISRLAFSPSLQLHTQPVRQGPPASVREPVVH